MTNEELQRENQRLQNLLRGAGIEYNGFDPHSEIERLRIELINEKKAYDTEIKRLKEEIKDLKDELAETEFDLDCAQDEVQELQEYVEELEDKLEVNKDD